MSKSDLPPEVVEVLEALGLDPDEVQVIELPGNVEEEYMMRANAATAHTYNTVASSLTRNAPTIAQTFDICPDCLLAEVGLLLATHFLQHWVDNKNHQNVTRDEAVKMVLKTFEEKLRSPTPPIIKGQPSDDNSPETPQPTHPGPRTPQ